MPWRAREVEQAEQLSKELAYVEEHGGCVHTILSQRRAADFDMIVGVSYFNPRAEGAEQSALMEADYERDSRISPF